jgi:hypothetical protein
MRSKLSMFAMAVVTATSLNAQAGTPCEPAAADPQQATRAFTMAELTRTRLASLDDEVVLIARAGQDLRKYNLTYSHMGFAVRQADGSWGLVHKLNECGTAHSSLYDEGLANFYSDSPFRYQAGIWRLEPAVQAKLKRALLGKKASDYHEPAYNMLAYPFSTRYQNSNGWVLELLAWALAPEDEANTRSSAQAWLKQAGYVPSTLELGTMTRLGARVTKANVAFDDHPGDLRWSGHIQTVTVDSMVSWLRTRPDACLDKGCPEIRVQLENGGL